MIQGIKTPGTVSPHSTVRNVLVFLNMTFKILLSQLKGVILEIGMDQINTRIILDESNLQNHCFWLRNAKFQKTKIFLTLEWGETVPGLLIPWLIVSSLRVPILLLGFWPHRLKWFFSIPTPLHIYSRFCRFYF